MELLCALMVGTKCLLWHAAGTNITRISGYGRAYVACEKSALGPECSVQAECPERFGNIMCAVYHTKRGASRPPVQRGERNVKIFCKGDGGCWQTVRKGQQHQYAHRGFRHCCFCDQVLGRARRRPRRKA